MNSYIIRQVNFFVQIVSVLQTLGCRLLTFERSGDALQSEYKEEELLSKTKTEHG